MNSKGPTLKDRFISVLGRDFYVQRVMFLSRLYHAFFSFRCRGKELMTTFLIPRNGVVFDIGANIGRFTGFAAQQVGPAGRVYSFEPVEMSARVLRAMLALRRCRQVTVIKAALSNQAGHTEINIPLVSGWKPQLSTAFVGNQPGAVRVTHERIELLTLDAFCAQQGVTRIDFIKCDTEGYEFFVFSGGLATLRQHRPAIYCEIEKPYLDRQNIDPDQIFTLLTSIGYRSFLPDGRGHLVPVSGYQTRGDYFFIHKEKMDQQLDKLVLK
jgi:FkbM family methyltransferase